MAPPYVSKVLQLVGASTYNTGCSGAVGRNSSCGSGDVGWTGLTCNGCSNLGCAEGNQKQCLRWNSQNSGANYCPAIGATVGSASYQGDASQRIICSYSTLPSDSKLFSDSEMSGVFDTTATVNPVSQMRDDRCAQYNFTALKADTTTCKPHYTSKGSYDLELFNRIVSEGPTWINNLAKRQHVFACITSSSQSLANDATNLFLDRINGVNGNSYAGVAVSNMPTDLKDTWGQYSEVVGFINQILGAPAPDGSTSGAASNNTRSMTVATVRSYCTANPTHSSCGCVNATKDGIAGDSKGADALLRCSTTDASLPGCDDLKDLNDKFAGITSPNLAPFVAGVKRAFIPRCYSSMCKAVDTGGSQNVLRPNVYDPGTCAGSINVCISSIAAGRDINADVSVQQDCAGATGQSFPSTLSSVSDRSGETVTVGGTGTPATTSGPTRQGCIAGTCTQGDETFQESDLIIKPGKSKFVDKYLQTPKKQKGAIGGFIFCLCCCCCLLLLLMMSGGEEGGSNASAAPAAPNYSANIAKLRELASSI